MENLYCELAHEIDESFRASSDAIEGKGSYDRWSYGEMASAGGAIAVSIGPLAGVPFFAGGLTVAGTTILGVTLVSPALIPTAVAALAVSTVLLAAGPSARGKATAYLKSRFKKAVHEDLEIRILGNPANLSSPSLKGKLLADLYGLALKRIEMIE